MREELTMNLKDLEKIIKLVESANINQFKLEEDGTTIEITKVDRTVVAPVHHQVYTQSAPVAAAPVAKAVPAEAPAKANPKSLEDNEVAILSPMVGAFYGASSPDSPNFVKVGDHVKKGDTVCILEAMKLFNEIESEFDGTVVRILAKNEDTVEYGQILMVLKKDA
jgi:acetyl-CoA carboxylase biotin carboxyl carrier protein